MTSAVQATIGLVANWNKSREAKVNDLFESNRGNYSKIEGLIRDMPKGGDIHVHLLGMARPNDLTKWAIEAKLFFDPRSMLFSNKGGPGLEPAESLQSNKAFYQKFLNTVTMISAAQISHEAPCNHFMYGCFGPIFSIIQYINPSKLLKKAREYAALDRVSYIEIYVGLSQLQDFVTMFETLDLDAYPKTRFICEASRINPLFEKEISAFAGLQKRFPKFIKSLTLVGPEYDPIADRDLIKQIKALDNIWSQITTNCPLAIHAGELTLNVSDPETMSNRLQETLKIRNIKRIGHGTCIMHAKERKEVIETMKANDITVEICLESNKKILQVEGRKHPLRYYLDNRVKVVLGSDDPGVLGTDLSEQFLVAFFDHRLSYIELKRLALNSITQSFLPGDSVFKENGDLKPLFTSALETGWSPQGSVKEFMETNEKARMELDLLQQFAHFEQSLIG